MKIWLLIIVLTAVSCGSASAQLVNACNHCGSSNYKKTSEEKAYDENSIVFIGMPLHQKLRNGKPYATRFDVSHVYQGPDMSSIIVHHNVANFRFLPNEHLITARKNKAGDFYYHGTKHGEVITDSDQADLKARKQAIEKLQYELHREECIQQILNRIYVIRDPFILDEPKIDKKCETYKDEVNEKYRARLNKN